MITNISRRVALIAAGIGVVLAIAACDGTSVAQPDNHRNLTPKSRLDDDTLNCLNGYIVVSGRTQCA
jgi:hypothetical protein